MEMNLLLFHFLQVALLVILLLSMTLFPFPQSAAALSLETDKEALISFRYGISLPSSNLLSSWTHDSSPCNWTGVSCNRLSQRVIGLNLSSLGVSGYISSHIGNLSFLQLLELDNNKLTGKIPEEICKLFNLRVMNMSFNSLQSSIPLNISNLIELRVLDLSMNQITGRIPEELTFISKLRVLNLGRNHLSGSIPPSIGNFSLLEDLILGTNSLDGVILADLSRLGNLKVLDLTINNLSGTVPASIYNMSSLVDLALASNQLWGKFPSNVGVTLPNLLDFNFCFNKFTGTIPASLHNVTSIQIIRVAHNFLEGTVPPNLENLPFLEMYNIGFNRIVSSGDNGLGFITSLTNSTNLKFVAIDGNLLHGVIPESVGNLSRSLSKLYMGGNQIYGRIPSSIAHLPSLTLLNLSYNSISGEIPSEIGQLEKLQVLDLAGNQISGNIPDSLGHLRRLNHIDLSGNELVGRIPNKFGDFNRLLSMDLSANKLNGSIPKEVLDLPSLSTILNLSNNFLSGSLLQEIGLLESVVTIDLSNNSLSGTIPNSIRNCKSLEKLYLAKNRFSGPIPSALGDLRGLEVLDISDNDLSGSIPPELGNQQVFQSVNLSFNDLEGKIPCRGIFTNLSRVQLTGNPRLSLHLACQNTPDKGRKLTNVYIIVAAVVTLCIFVGVFFCVRRRKGKIVHSSSSIKRQHQLVSYHDLRRATSHFDEQNLIGKGGYGTVYKGWLEDGSAVAIKVLDIKQTGFNKAFLAECEALRNTRHRNLVQLITSCSSMDSRNTQFLALVYKFLGNGSLEDWIKGKRKNEHGNGLNLLERLNVAIDVANAMDYLHNDCEIPVVHCDLKPGNILLDEDMTAKVGDFGLARFMMEKMGHDQALISSTYALKGSVGYIPPEYGLGMKPSPAGDVYSYGVLLLELFTGKSPTDESFVGQLQENLIEWVLSAFPVNILKVVDSELQFLMNNYEKNDLVMMSPEIQKDCLVAILGIGLSCTAISPDNRITMRIALRKLEDARNGFFGHTPRD